MTEAEGRLEDFPHEVCSCVFIHKKAILDRAALDTALLVGMVLTQKAHSCCSPWYYRYLGK